MRDTMIEAIALSSPCGKMSKRSLVAAQERIRRELFGDGLVRTPTAQPTERETDLKRAQELRGLAARGMKPRAYMREAQRLEAKWEGKAND